MPYAGHGVPCRWRKYGQMSRYENLSAFLFSFPLNMKHFSAWQVFRLVSLPNFLPAPEGQWIKCCPVSYRDTRQWICPGFTPGSLFIPEVRMYTGTPLAFMFTNIQNRMIYAIILTRKIHGRGRKKKGGGIARENNKIKRERLGSFLSRSLWFFLLFFSDYPPLSASGVWVRCSLPFRN